MKRQKLKKKLKIKYNDLRIFSGYSAHSNLEGHVPILTLDDNKNDTVSERQHSLETRLSKHVSDAFFFWKSEDVATILRIFSISCF